MEEIRNKDLIVQIEGALSLGTFIPYNRVSDFISGLEIEENKIYKLLENRKAKQAVSLYEILLSGCYEKAEEIDDSGGELGMFFAKLFCSWIEARQKAKYDSKETISQVLKWIENDDYGFCYNIEESIIEIFCENELKIFESSIKSRFDDAYLLETQKEDKQIYNYSHPVIENTNILKIIYTKKKDIKSYLSLCEKTGLSPKDCEVIALIYKNTDNFKEALKWVEKGLKLEEKDNWKNESSFKLKIIKRELSSLLGNNNYAIESAWSDYKKYPSEYSYDELMKYVEKKDIDNWHNKAIEVAKKTSLDSTIELFIQTKELDILAERILAVKSEELENISHYKMEEAAKVLLNKNSIAAAKIYCAMGMRILNSGKSKYYDIALEHFLKVKTIYNKNNSEDKWISIVRCIRENHVRKYSFIPYFEELVSGKYPSPEETFTQIAKKRWDKQVSS
jgi:tetratricopeptide (TPR) repeat protein